MVPSQAVRSAPPFTHPLLNGPRGQQPSASTAQAASNTSPSHEERLHKEIVSILASAANGCIIELGYPQLLQQYKVLKAQLEEANKLINGLKEEKRHRDAVISREIAVKDEAIRVKDLVIREREAAIVSLQQQMAFMSKSLKASSKVSYVLIPSHSPDPYVEGSETETAVAHNSRKW